MPATLRAARPTVWISATSERRKPSLLASSTATSETSGKSKPSRSRLIPTNTSNSPKRKSRRISTRSNVLNIRMQVAHPDVELFKVVGEVFGHALGHGRDQDPLAPFGPLPYFFDKVVDLPLLGTHLNGGIDQSCRPDHLLDHHTARLLQLVLRRRGRHEDRPSHPLLKFLEYQRPIVVGRRQAEAVLDQGLLARAVAANMPRICGTVTCDSSIKSR